MRTIQTFIKTNLVSLALIASLCVLGLNASLPRTANGQAFDPATDGIATNYDPTQQFGGRFDEQRPTLTFSTFLPTGFGFTNGSDRLSYQFTFPGNTARAGSDSTCTAVTGGLNCTATLNLVDMERYYTPLVKGVYTVTFTAQHPSGHGFGEVFFNNGTDSAPDYSTTGTYSINPPLHGDIYSEFTGAADTVSLVDATKTTLPLKIRVNKENTPTSVSVSLDGKAVQTNSSPTTVSDSRFTPSGQAAEFDVTLTGMDKLSNGTHTITAIVTGSGYTSNVATVNGSTGITLNVSYDNSAACTTQLKGITKITNQAITKRTAELQNVALIDTKLRAYITNQNPKTNPYASQLTAVDAKQSAAQTAILALSDDNQFSSCQDMAKQVGTFTTQLDSTRQATIDYRDSLLQLITTIQGQS
ncbi:MAG: hypothetical protein WDN27_01830 [Candidatus Saccharibacteria bacterium]